MLTASALCVVLAVGADLLLLGVQRLLTPWTRTRRAPGTGRAGRLARPTSGKAAA